MVLDIYEVKIASDIFKKIGIGSYLYHAVGCRSIWKSGYDVSHLLLDTSTKKIGVF